VDCSRNLAISMLLYASMVCVSAVRLPLHWWWRRRQVQRIFISAN